MDIITCYKILELDREASMGEAREAYIDMARVWHPDRFTDSPRLRKKAEEKFKEINIAYAEITSLLSTKSETLQTKKTDRWTQEALEAIYENITDVKDIAHNQCARACSILRKIDFKQIFRQLFHPKNEHREMVDRKNKNNDGILKGTRRMDKGRNRHRNFADIYEEVARDRKEEKRKMGGMN